MKSTSTYSKQFGLFFLVGMLLSNLYAHAQLAGDSFAEAKKKGVADVVFTFVETPGFASKEGTEVKGFCVELMNEFSKWLEKEEGVVLKPVYHDKNSKQFTQFMTEVKQARGGVFGLGTFTITEERKKTYNFSPSFISNIAILMTNKSVQDLRNLNEISTAFNGMTIVTVKGSEHEKQLLKIKGEYLPGANVKYVNSFEEVLEEIVRNERAFTELDFTYYLSAIKKQMPVKHHSAGNKSSEDFGIIMPQNSDWAPVMTRFMKSGFMESVTYRKLISDHLGHHALKLLDAVAAN